MIQHAKRLALCALTLLAGGCGTGGASLPEGETNLGCGAAIYAAANLVDKSYLTEDDRTSLGSTIGLITKYGTAYAEEEKIPDGTEAFNRIKIEAYRVKDRDSSPTIVARARKCAGLPPKA